MWDASEGWWENGRVTVGWKCDWKLKRQSMKVE